MRFLVTGGTGLIGKRLVKSLIASNHQVTILSRNPAKFQFPAGVQGQQWDGRTTTGWDHIVNETDVIVNLAGENIAGGGKLPQRWNATRKQRIHDSRRFAGQALVEAVKMAAEKPRLLFQVSGIDFYPPGDALVTEDDAPGSTFLGDVVVNSWEPSTAAVESWGVRRIVGRLGPLLSLDGGPLPSSMLPFKFFVGGQIGNGRQWFSWIHEEDAVRAIHYLVEQEEAAGVFNIVAPNPVTNKEFSKVLGKVMERPSLIPTPAFALKLALGEMSALILEGRKVSCQRLLDTGFTFKFPELQEALPDLLNA